MSIHFNIIIFPDSNNQTPSQTTVLCITVHDSDAQSKTGFTLLVSKHTQTLSMTTQWAINNIMRACVSACHPRCRPGTCHCHLPPAPRPTTAHPPTHTECCPRQSSVSFNQSSWYSTLLVLAVAAGLLRPGPNYWLIDWNVTATVIQSNRYTHYWHCCLV